MTSFGSAIAVSRGARDAALEAARGAKAALGGAAPKLAIAFASAGYRDLDEVPAAIQAVLGPVPLVGGTSGGCLIGPHGIASRGVSVIVLGGEGIAASVATARVSSPDLHDVVPAAESLTRISDGAARDGLGEFACLAFAPGLMLDGEALVAALRKGAGVRAQLAGGLTGDDLTFDRTRAFANGAVHDDHVVIAGIYTRTALGIAARHGWRAVGPARTISQTDGAWLITLDGRPAFDVWLEDARAAGAEPPRGRGQDVALYLANHYELGLEDRQLLEPLVRAPFEIREDGAVRLSASVPECKLARVMHATRADMFEAARDAARNASEAAGGAVAGALVLSCTGRMMALGDDFALEAASISKCLDAPVGGSCVFGEIARARRDVDAFHNTTAVVVAIPS